jgi:hypothetical protein
VTDQNAGGDHSEHVDETQPAAAGYVESLEDE